MIRVSILLCALIAACNAPVEPDPAERTEAPEAQRETRVLAPFEAEFLDACIAKPEYAPAGFYGTKPITPESFCACLFTTAMEGLTEDEQLAAAFYLLSQSGVDLSGRPEFRQAEPTAAIGGSEGVGRAVIRCGA